MWALGVRDLITAHLKSTGNSIVAPRQHYQTKDGAWVFSYHQLDVVTRTQLLTERIGGQTVDYTVKGEGDRRGLELTVVVHRRSRCLPVLQVLCSMAVVLLLLSLRADLQKFVRL